MDTLQLIAGGFFDSFTLLNLLLMALGVLIGIVFGAIPGMTTNMALILFLPMTYGLGMLPSMLFLLGIYCGGTYGGSITAILIGTPGTNVAVATMFDGYPLAQKGAPGKALHIALFASTIGGLISAVLLLFVAPVVAEYILKFGPPEYFALAVLGLSIIAGVSGKSLLRGLIAGCFGMLLACVGIDAGSSVTRFAFKNVYLMSGLNVMPVMMAMFAIPNIFSKILTRQYEKKFEYSAEVAKSDRLTKEEKKRCVPVIAKSTAIGAVIGAVPAAGAAIASMISYNEAKRTSKNGNKFGTGELEGIAAPEAANNAVTGTSFIPLFTLGIPGSAVASILVGAFTMNGLQVGPTLFRNQSELMYGIMVGLIFCNIIMWVEGTYLQKVFAKIAKVPQPVLVTALTLFCVAGCYAVSNQMFNVYLMMGMGVFFYITTKLNFPLASMILGFILGSLAETNLKNSLVMSEGSWSIFFTRPIVLVILIITVAVTVLTVKPKKADKNVPPLVDEDDEE